VFDDGAIAVADIQKMNPQHRVRLVGIDAQAPCHTFARPTNIPRIRLALSVRLLMTAMAKIIPPPLQRRGDLLDHSMLKCAHTEQ
jgi:hypothetical protein